MRVCTPSERAEVVTLAPVPRVPSRLEVQTRLAARSSSSITLAVRVRAVASVALLASAGAVMVTVGGPFTTTVIVLLPVAPRESVAEAVMVWAPTESAEVVTLAPAPNEPSRSELQVRLALTSPSSGSLALPEKVMAVPVSSVVRETQALRPVRLPPPPRQPRRTCPHRRPLQLNARFRARFRAKNQGKG